MKVYKDWDEIAEIIKKLIEDRGDIPPRNIFNWINGTTEKIRNNSLVNAAEWCNFKDSELDYFKKGIKVFVRKAAKRNHIKKKYLYGLIDRDPDGNLRDWDLIIELIEKEFSEIFIRFRKEDLTPLSASIALKELYSLQINKKDIRCGIGKFKDAIRKYEKKQTSSETHSIDGVWKGWSIYPIERGNSKMHCYNVMATFTQSGPNKFDIEETIIKECDLKNKKYHDLTPLSYSGDGYLLDPNIFCTIKLKNLDIWARMHFIWLPGKFPKSFNEMKGFATIYKPYDIYVAAMKLRRADQEDIPPMEWKEVIEEFPDISSFSETKVNKLD